MTRTDARTDVATAEMLRNALAVAAEEASIVVVKSAYSTFVVEGADAAAAILDGDAQLIAQSMATTLAHGASIRCSLVSVMEDIPPARMQPGDVYAMNDVYRGGIHANDVIVIRPVFVEGVPRFFTGTIIHIGDVGGESAGGIAAGAAEVYSEGLQLPPVRVATADGMNDEVLRIIALNSRTPEGTLGDLRALIAGCNVAARRLEGLVEEYGTDAFRWLVAEYLDYTEARMRAGLAALTDGTYRGEYMLDDDGRDPNRPVTVRVAVTIDGDSATVDFEGTDPQVNSAINCGYSQTTSAVMFGLRCFLDGTIPMNEGCFRPVDVRLPYGSLVNPAPPRPAGGRNFVMCAVIDAIIQALATAEPDKAIAASGILQPLTISQARSGPNPWIHMSYEYGGLGARNGSDGPDATGIHFGLSRNTIPQIEPLEAKTPFVIERKEFIPDSGGVGQWRGGLGCRTVFRLLEDAIITMRGDRMTFPPPGRGGGLPGRPGGYYRRAVDGTITRLANKTPALVLTAGESLIVETSGGGGLGPAGDRDPALVRGDVRDGRITPDHAQAAYGVTFSAR